MSEQYYTVPPEQIPEVVEAATAADLVVLFEGPSGVGKTEQTMLAGKRLAEKAGLEFVIGEPKKGQYGFHSVHMGNHEAVDFSLPYTYEEGGVMRQGRAMLDILPTVGPGMLNMDRTEPRPLRHRGSDRIQQITGHMDYAQGHESGTDHEQGSGQGDVEQDLYAPDRPPHTDHRGAHCRGIPGAQQGRRGAGDRIDPDVVPRATEYASG